MAERKGGNPMESNIPITKKAFSELIHVVKENCDSGDFFDVSTSVNLKLRSGEELPCKLNYSASKGIFSGKHPVIVCLAIINDSDLILPINKWIPLSKREFYMDVRKGDLGFDHVNVRSKSDTQPVWEGNGFAKSLIERTDDIIYHCLDHFTVWDSSLPCFAIIVDRAKGKVKNRDNWSTDQAQELNYNRISSEALEKRYR